jgi:hypothetical protein
MYNEIFQALVVDGDALLPNPFLDLCFDGVIRWKLPATEMFYQFAKHVKVTTTTVGLSISVLNWFL